MAQEVYAWVRLLKPSLGKASCCWVYQLSTYGRSRQESIVLHSGHEERTSPTQLPGTHCWSKVEIKKKQDKPTRRPTVNAWSIINKEECRLTKNQTDVRRLGSLMSLQRRLSLSDKQTWFAMLMWSSKWDRRHKLIEFKKSLFETWNSMQDQRKIFTIFLQSKVRQSLAR